MIRFLFIVAMMIVPQAAFAMNREKPVSMERGGTDLRSVEKPTELQRDLLGRKVVIDPDSKIDAGSLFLDVAPGSTVMIRAKQYNNGVQTVKTPLYNNVEIPN